ncbi:MAG: LysM peptidoglycan-binding domain-containing protein [Pseudomonadota bacterium]
MVDDELSGGPGSKVGNDEEKACVDGVYDPWHRAKPSSFKRVLGRSETPFLLIGATLIVLIIIFFVFVPRNGQEDMGRKLAVLEKSIGPLEDKLLRLEEQFAKIPVSGDAGGRIEKQAAACERAVDRFESVEASLTMRIERLAQEVEKLKNGAIHIDKKATMPPKAGIPAAVPADKKVAAPPKAKNGASSVQAEKKADATPKVAGATAVQGKTTYHEVRAGETLFRISKQYNLTVDALRRLNKLTEKDPITPGQKLMVTGAGPENR